MIPGNQCYDSLSTNFSTFNRIFATLAQLASNGHVLCLVNRLHSMKLLRKLWTKLISTDRLTDGDPTLSQKAPIYLKSKEHSSGIRYNQSRGKPYCLSVIPWRCIDLHHPLQCTHAAAGLRMTHYLAWRDQQCFMVRSLSKAVPADSLDSPCHRLTLAAEHRTEHQLRERPVSIVCQLEW